MLLQTIYSMASGGIGTPSCQIVLDHERDSYKEDDDVRGVVIIQTGGETQTVVHDGIKISLTGMIGKYYYVQLSRFRILKAGWIDAGYIWLSCLDFCWWRKWRSHVLASFT